MSPVWLLLLLTSAALASPAPNCVCVPFTQCGEDGFVLEYGDLVTIDVRFGHQCGDDELCCNLASEEVESEGQHATEQFFQNLLSLSQGSYHHYTQPKTTKQPILEHWVEETKKPVYFYQEHQLNYGKNPENHETWHESTSKPHESTSEPHETTPNPYETHQSHKRKHCKEMEDDVVLVPELPKYQYGCGLRRQINLDARFQTSHSLHRERTFYGEFPWTVALWKKGTEQFICGGSLIEPDIVLTAAHCVLDHGHKIELTVTAGDWDIECDSEPLSRQVRAVRRSVVHEEFKNSSLLNDIALLVLEEPVVLNQAVDLVCLSQEIPHGECLATGWASARPEGEESKLSSSMSMVPLTLVKRDTCVKKLKTTRLGKYFKLHRSFICAGGQENTDTCKGDGGGPLVCQNREDPEGRFVQVGIVSWGIDCGTDVPAVYTSVSHFYSWIAEHLHL